MKNCSGINCPMQYGVVDTATCPSVECCPYATPPLTNADRIRSMTDEELAIVETAKGGCPHDCETPDDLDTNCVECWLDWLKQEGE